MLQFDEKGHLYPYKISELTLDGFQHFFVINIADEVHRGQLFGNYLRFLKDLKLSLKAPFYQWIGGSFVTDKEFPEDIDLVTFIDYNEFLKNIFTVDHFTSTALKKYNVDAHFAPFCKWNHRYHKRSKQIENDWLEVYGTTRLINGVRAPKGIIKIDFRNEQRKSIE